MESSPGAESWEGVKVCDTYGPRAMQPVMEVLMDEVKALDWVYENIAGFGGDPENITIGGQSGGTAKSGALAGSPMQKGRVKRVINQSNLNWMGRDINTMAEAEEMGRKFLEYKKIDPDITPEELRALPSDVFYGKLSPMDMEIGAMCVDGKYLMHAENYKNIDEFACDCDYISGGNYGEMSMRKEFGPGSKDAVTEQEYYKLAKMQLGDLYEKYEFEKNFPCTPENADKIEGYTGLESTLDQMLHEYLMRQNGLPK